MELIVNPISLRLVHGNEGVAYVGTAAEAADARDAGRPQDDRKGCRCQAVTVRCQAAARV